MEIELGLYSDQGKLVIFHAIPVENFYNLSLILLFPEYNSKVLLASWT